MNEPALRGEVVQADYVSQPHSFAAHDFFTTLREIAHRTLWHDEGQKDAALNAIDAYEKHVVPGADLKVVTSESDHAPREDVSLRVASTAAAAVAPSQNIDYARLAAAIVAAQAAKDAQDAAPATVITDAPAPPPAGGYPQA